MPASPQLGYIAYKIVITNNSFAFLNGKSWFCAIFAILHIIVEELKIYKSLNK